MRRLGILFFLFSLHAHAAQVVKVRIKQNLNTIHLNAEKWQIGTQIFSGPLNIIYKEPFNWQLQIEGKNFIINKSELNLRGERIYLDSVLLPEHLYLKASKQYFDLIGSLDLESYIAGVLSAEMPSSWPIEALKAQAVAARSYTLATLKSPKQQSHDLEASVMDQVFNYKGNFKEKLNNSHPIWRAVQQTKGQVILENGRVKKAYYHADCGGSTLTARSAWGDKSEPLVVQDPYCASHGERWVFRVQKDRLLEKMKLQGIGSRQVALLDFKPQDGGRLMNLELKWQEGDLRKKQLIKGEELRSLIGYQSLKSTNFKVTDYAGTIEFKGQGFGHGVGLCQNGSRSWALQGWDYRRILRHYYPMSVLKYGIN